MASSIDWREGELWPLLAVDPVPLRFLALRSFASLMPLGRRDRAGRFSVGSASLSWLSIWFFQAST